MNRRVYYAPKHAQRMPTGMEKLRFPWPAVIVSGIIGAGTIVLLIYGLGVIS